jgi:two-component system sensor histidine kinase NblS
VRNIIEKHHSHVHLVSEVGVGTTFWFDLPVFQKDTPLLDGALNNGKTTDSPAPPSLEPQVAK